MLIDEMLRHLGTGHIQDEKLQLALTIALRFQVDNVAAYHYREMRDGKTFSIQDRIPNIAPLSSVMWFEYGGLSVEKPCLDIYGCMLSIDYWRDQDYRSSKWVGQEIPDDFQWILRAEYWGKTAKYRNNIMVCDWIYYLAVGDNGEHLHTITLPNERHYPITPHFEADENQRYKLHAELLISLLSICFSHCKGTAIEEHKPTRQVRRAAERAGNPIFTYHTVDIHPSTRVLQSEGRISENGMARALHICRGHFAHYTAEKPLFGKYTGTFYRPMHVRGNAEQGATFKDYRIHPLEASSV